MKFLQVAHVFEQIESIASRVEKQNCWRIF